VKVLLVGLQSTARTIVLNNMGHIDKYQTDSADMKHDAE